VNISKTKKDTPKRKTSLLSTLKSPSNEPELFFFFIGTLIFRVVTRGILAYISGHLKTKISKGIFSR